MKVAITGAQSYTGRYVSQILLKRGTSIVNLTNHKRQWGIKSQLIQDVPLTFSREHLIQTLRGCSALVQTYWVRFDNQLGFSREQVTNNSKMLIDCAKEAGVKKIIYTSHTKTSLDSPLAYIQEKARVQQYLRQSGLQYGIVKPCGIFGRSPQEGIVINNIAYLVRFFPVFALPGDGKYRFQMVHVEDMAQLIVQCLDSNENREVDAVGVDDISFTQLIEVLAKQMNTTCKPITGIPSQICLGLTQPLNWYFNDILIDKNDLEIMTSGLTCSNDIPVCKRSLISWIRENKDTLGRQWISSVHRYYK